MSHISKEHVADIEDSLKSYPLLHFSNDTNGPQIRGTWEVKFGNTLIESYEILIDLIPGYPSNVPLVYEVGGKIPKHMDRHLTSPNWYACLFVQDSRWEAWPLGASFRSFLAIPVHNFFLAQANFDEFGRFPNGEYGHGNKGVKEYYREKFELKNPLALVSLLYATSLETLPEKCPCNLGKKTNLCHGRMISTLRKNIPYTIRASAYSLFVEEVKSEISGNYIKQICFFDKIYQSPPDYVLKNIRDKK